MMEGFPEKATDSEMYVRAEQVGLMFMVGEYPPEKDGGYPAETEPIAYSMAHKLEAREERQAMGLTQYQHVYQVLLPRYQKKVETALSGSKQTAMLL